MSRFKRQTIATEPSDEISRGIPIAFDGHVAVVAVVADEETALANKNAEKEAEAKKEADEEATAKKEAGEETALAKKTTDEEAAALPDAALGAMLRSRLDEIELRLGEVKPNPNPNPDPNPNR